jgi:hypothetical protein
MRRFLVSLTAVILGCSKAAGPAADSPTVVIPPALAIPTATSASAPIVAPPAPTASFVRLPDQPYDPLYPTYRSIDWAAGQPPGPAFEAGTVYVVTREPALDDPVWVSEWDLARASVVRKVMLPVPRAEGDPWILRVGDQLRVVVESGESLSYVQLTADLRVEHVEHWASHVELPGVGVVVADAELTAVEYPGYLHLGNELMLATFDASGRRRATRSIPHGHSSGPDTVVLGDRVFVLTSEYGRGLELQSLDADLNVRKHLLISREPEGNIELETRDGRLQVITGYPESHAIEFSPSLERLGPATPVELPRFIALGDERVHLCSNGQARLWLMWTRTADDPCVASPKALLEKTPEED